MGFFDSTTTITESAKSAPLSARGEEYSEIHDVLLAARLEEFGWDVDLDTKEVFTDKKEAAKKKGDLAVAESNRDRSQQAYDDFLANTPRTGGFISSDERRVKTTLDNDNIKVDEARRNLESLEKETIQDFTLTKREDPRVEQAIDKFGADSPEVAAVREDMKAQEVFKAESMAGIEKEYLTNLRKYMSGDMSYTPEQEAQVNKFIDPVKNVLIKTTDDLLDRFSDNQAQLRDSLNDIGKAIDKTGFAIEDALQAAEIQVAKSGDRLISVLERVNDSAEARAKFEFDLLAEKIDVRAAQQAAMLGLPPGSQAEELQKAKLKSDALTKIQLDLSDKEMRGTLAIRSAEEAGKQKISLARIDLAKDIGAEQIGLSKAKSRVLGASLAKEETVVAARGEALTGLERTKQSQLFDASFGNIPSIIGQGQAGLKFEPSLDAARASLLGGIAQPVTGQLGIEQKRQFFEAEKTKTIKEDKGFFSALTDVVGAGLGIGSLISGFGKG